jgi:O-acetyl-ADP-ribose deacetylase (regulator of RNase III)
MPLKIARNDICEMKVDAIVNAANSALKMGGGVCGAIFAAAGADKLQAECDRIGRCIVGEAVITGGYDLPAKYVIHTVGPVWQGGGRNEAELLYRCYINSLQLALEYKLKSIAFPLISSGIYGYPKDQALRIAITAISDFLLSHEMMVYLVVFDKKAFMLSEKIFTAIEKYIDDHYVEEHLKHDRRRRHRQALEIKGSRSDSKFSETEEDVDSQLLEENILSYNVFDSAPAPDVKRSLEDVLGQLDESFSEMLLRLIDEKGMTDVETYQRANIDRKLFSKIRSRKDYKPKKVTAIAFAIALRLNLDETRDLLGKAGYALSHSSKFDLIIEYFIQEGNYNINEINEALFAFDQVLLGA